MESFYYSTPIAKKGEKNILNTIEQAWQKSGDRTKNNKKLFDIYPLAEYIVVKIGSWEE